MQLQFLDITTHFNLLLLKVHECKTEGQNYLILMYGCSPVFKNISFIWCKYYLHLCWNFSYYKNILHCMLLHSLLLCLRVYTIVQRKTRPPSSPALQGGITCYFAKQLLLHSSNAGMFWNGCLCLLCNTATFHKDSKWQGHLISAQLPLLSFLFFFLDSAIWKYKQIAYCLKKSVQW